MLNNVEWCIDIDSVQDLWNDIVMKIVRVVDVIVQLTTMINNRVPDPIPPKCCNTTSYIDGSGFVNRINDSLVVPNKQAGAK